MEEKYLETLSAHGLSNTKSRRDVFLTLQSAEGPLSMRQIIDANPGIDRVTIYRVIDAFEKTGISKKIQLGWKYKIELGDTFHDHHHHMTCTNCGKIIAFEESKSFDQELEKIALDHSFSIKSHNLELLGICRECQS